MDHDTYRSPTLWVTSDTDPFAEAGFLPVKYSSTLKETVFADFYEEEHTKTYLDNLNLLYVALTRAEKGMIIMSPTPKSAKRNSVSHLLFNSITESTLSSHWNPATSEYAIGTWQKQAQEKEKKSADAVSLKSYPSYRWRDKIVIRQTAKNYFDPSAEEKFEKINFGIHLHTILSRIGYADEIEDALQRTIEEGLITNEEKPEVQEQLRALLNIPTVANWFSSEWEVRTEVPILLPDGIENRIDRLMIKDKKAIIVDFKTGEPLKSDQRQVISYMEILRKMNFLDVEGYLLYIRRGEVVSVPPGKVKATKKKDESQLGLF
jgi:ATP-dependent exoDNAse (exonuclease V) beta subunit